VDWRYKRFHTLFRTNPERIVIYKVA